MGNPVVHFEVLGEDGEALRSFYSGLFDWPINADNEMNYGLVDPEGMPDPSSREGASGIAGGIGQAPAGYGGHVTFYVEVEDVEAALQRAEELGGTRVMGPETIMEGVTLGQFTDPEGHVVGLLQATGGAG